MLNFFQDFFLRLQYLAFNILMHILHTEPKYKVQIIFLVKSCCFKQGLVFKIRYECVILFVYQKAFIKTFHTSFLTT